jgi:ABC-type polysaccharide transport system permease subunit
MGNTILNSFIEIDIAISLNDLLHLKNISYGIEQILVGHFISAIVFVVFSFILGDNYTIDHVLNGKKDDPILIWKICRATLLI